MRSNLLVRALRARLSSFWSRDAMVFHIDETWSSDHKIGLRGFLFGRKGPVRNAHVTVGGQRVEITSWHDRPDVQITHAHLHPPLKCGFWVEVPRKACHSVQIEMSDTDGHRDSAFLEIRGRTPAPPADIPDSSRIMQEFIRQVNENRWSVLEIGSRIVSPGSSSKRSWFPSASSYVGFDYYQDDNTDVVGDAHRLSDYFPPGSFDAVFSVVVLEHLAMPWVVAMEINKVMKIGGLTCHATPFAWPAHDRPWDFYRYSDEGLKALFSPALGFETIQAGMHDPLRMVFDLKNPGQEGFPTVAGFGSAAILARKVADVDSQKFRWETDQSLVLGSESHYPLPAPKKMSS